MTPRFHESVALFFFLSCASCQNQRPAQQGPPEVASAVLSAQEPILTRDGALQVRWQTRPPEIPIGEDFEILLHIEQSHQPHAPLLGAAIQLQGFMPAHGHGMVREPRSVEEGAGNYRIPAALLHMEGHWEMSFAILIGNSAHAADFVLDL